MIFAIAFECRRLVAAVPVRDKNPICGFNSRFSATVEICNPFQASFVMFPSVRGRSNTQKLGMPPSM